MFLPTLSLVVWLTLTLNYLKHFFNMNFKEHQIVILHTSN